MPAIQPARLKQQASDLASRLDQPDVFVRQLRLLLDLYTDYTNRTSRPGGAHLVSGAYQASPQVVRQVWHEIAPLIRSQPEHGFRICDALWEQPNLDLQLFAARVLGNLPVNPSNPVTSRIQSWISKGLDRYLLDGLLDAGLAGLHKEQPKEYLDLVSSWLDSTDLNFQQAGLRSLLILINQTRIDNLPTVYHMLVPFIRIAPPRLRTDIVSVISALIDVSPAETAFLLRQNLTTPDNPDTPWLIRQVLSEFPREQQASLRQALKSSR